MKGFGYLVKEGFKNVYANRIMSIASVCVLVSCLVMTGAAALFSLNVQGIVSDVEKTNETTVYISLDCSETEARQIGSKIEALPNVESASFVSKQKAFEQYGEALGEDIFNRIKDDKNPLPDAYRVVFKDLEKYDDTVKQIKNIDGVDSINDRREFANKLSSVSSLVGIISIAVVAALIIISIFIIANTIRATMYSRRFEISIMKSVGATNMFVRMPFLVEGMVIGFISAALSTGAVALLYEGVKRIIVDVAGPWVKVISFSEIVVPLALIFILVGVLVGLFGGFISIRKYLKKEGNEILGW